MDDRQRDEAREELRRHGRTPWPADEVPTTPQALHREEEVEALLRWVREGASVLLVGAEGVGRKAIVREAARRLAVEDDTATLELISQGLLAGTRFLGESTTRLDRVIELCRIGRVVLHVLDLASLPTAGRTTDGPPALWDRLAPELHAGRLVIVGESTPEGLRSLDRHPGFLTAFRRLVVEPMAQAAVLDVVRAEAEEGALPLDEASLRALVDLSDRFLPGRPQPSPALDLLGRVADYRAQKEGIGELESVTPAFIERVLSIYTGLPRFVLSRATTRSASEIRGWFETRLVGQREAIEALCSAIAIYKSGLHDARRPLGTFLFVGPAGVGKTELTRALAEYVFGSAHRLLRFDLATYADADAVDRLLGSAEHPGAPALLADAVRRQPFQVVLFDELERAHPSVHDMLQALLGEGRVLTPRGEVVSLRQAFVVCTSQVGAEVVQRRGPGVTEGVGGWRSTLLDALQGAFPHDLVSRFQHLVPFHPLDADQVRQIARQEIKAILKREGITSRNLVVEVDDAAIDLVVRAGFDPRWGARGLSREIQRRLVMPLATALLEHKVDPGEILKLTGQDGHVRVRRIETSESRALRRGAEAEAQADRAIARDDADQVLRQLHEDLDALALGVDEAGLQARQAELVARREDPAFWQRPDEGAREVRDLDDVLRVLDRVDRLRTRIEDAASSWRQARTAREVTSVAHRLDQLRDTVAEARRELVLLGPEGAWDALVEVRPLHGKALARDLVTRLYVRWAEHRGHEVVWLHDPVSDEEPAHLAIKGRYASGLLRLEAGIHRVREGEENAMARVRVAPWTDRVVPVVFGEHRALKGFGALGGKVRSRLVCEGGLVLQNGRTLAENRDLAIELGAAWAHAPASGDVIVRRYDLTAPHLRDALTGEITGSPDAFEPERFHELLCARVDRAGEGPDAA